MFTRRFLISILVHLRIQSSLSLSLTHTYSTMTHIQFLVTTITSIIYIRQQPKRKYPPTYNPAYLPLLGGFLEFAKNPLEALRRGYQRCGDCFTINMMGKRMTFLVGPEAHEVFFKASDDELSQEEVYKFMIPVFGKGVVYDAPPKIRRQQFRFLGTGLRGRRLKSYVPLLIQEAQDFFSKWGDSGEVDILDKLSELTILTASRCLMGQEVREKLFEEVAGLFHTLDKGITPLSVFWPHAPVPSHWARDRARKDMVKLLSPVIRKKREEIKKDPDGDHGDDMLAFLVQVKYKDGRYLTVHEIVGFFVALLFAGQHTSSITATWTTLFLAHHPKILERVVTEQDDILKESSKDNFKDVDFADVGKMDLGGRCIKEALRMFPPLILLLRHVRKARNYKGMTIPKNDIVVASPGMAMRLPNAFDKPEMYDPDRWLRNGGGMRKTSTKFDFIGFGGGMHACAGTQFAYLQLRVVLLVLFQNFEIEPVCSELPKPDYTAMVVGPIHGKETRIRYRRRSSDRRKVTSSSSSSSSSSSKVQEDTKYSNEYEENQDVKIQHRDEPTYTKAEIRKHKTKDDCWLIVENGVYDVTKYVAIHPGGDAILSRAGEDATEGFNGPQHPPHARTTLEQFRIGRLHQ
jgi:sterol 14alpha-demethylase